MSCGVGGGRLRCCGCGVGWTRIGLLAWELPYAAGAALKSKKKKKKKKKERKTLALASCDYDDFAGVKTAVNAV